MTFLCGVYGHKGPSASFSCLFCYLPKASTSDQFNILLDNVVPLTLHIFLGIVLDTF